MQTPDYTAHYLSDRLALHRAILHNQHLQPLLVRKPHLLNATCWAGNTPLHLACKPMFLCLQSARALLEQGADPNLENGRGDTPLTLAARSRHTELCRTLLAAGARVLPQTMRALHSQSNLYDKNRGYRQQAVLTTLLLQHGGNADEDCSPKTPSRLLADSISCGTPETVAALLQAGASAYHYHPELQSTVLQWAALHSRAQLCLLLIEHGADAGELDGYHIYFTTEDWQVLSRHLHWARRRWLVMYGQDWCIGVSCFRTIVSFV